MIGFFEVNLTLLVKKIVKPLNSFEENKDSEGFDEYRNVLKVLTYFSHQFIEKEVRSMQEKKKRLNLQKGGSK